MKRLLAINWRRILFPFLSWFGELRNPDTLRADAIAGVTVALVLVPQSMAYAQLASLPPHYGLYASFLPVIVAALLGSSRQLATGPVAVVSLLTAAALEPIASASPEGYLAYALVLAVMVGIIQFTLGALRLGMLVDFLSHPVVIGFTNAAAIIIATSQIGKIFGVSAERAAHQYETIWNTVLAAWHGTHLATLGMAMLALTIMTVMRHFSPKFPGVLIAVVVTTLLAWLTDFEAAGGAVVGVIPEGLPALTVPEFDPRTALQLVGAALTIALIGFMEAIAIAKAMAAQTRQRLDPNQELIGQGLANVTAGFFSGYAVSGSFSRSAVNLAAGAKSGWSSIITGLLMGITLLALTPLLYHLPQATLAAVIIMAVVGLINVEPVRHAWKVHRMDAVVAVITFVLTLILAPELHQSVIVGVLLSLGLFIYRTMRPSIVVMSRHPDGTLRDAQAHILQTCPSISMFRFDGPLFFANTGYFEDKVLERVAAKPELKFIIVDAISMNEVDATGEEMLHQLTRRLTELGIIMLFARCKKPLMDIFMRTGFAGPEWAHYFFRTRADALEYAWEQLGDNHKDDCALYNVSGGN
ncbi:MAG: SulP family inorganic anion transporter [Gammaproteobacteria bacterium]